jgi:hypothetical protein
MMAPEAQSIILTLHIALGFGGFLLGAIALALPKFGRTSRWHRRAGRAYALCMVGMGVLSVPLSLRANDYFLLIIGLLTLGWVAGGWIALRLALRARQANRHTFATMLRTHIVLMGSSYIAAWTAFLVNVRPLGSAPLLFWVYAVGPTVIGTVFISRASARFVKTA